MRITHACSVLATAAYVIPATETAASRWRRGSARPAPLHGLFGGGAKEDVAAGLADDELEVELTRPLGVTVQEGANGRVLVQGCRAAAARRPPKPPGDEVIGVSAVFGAGVWRCEGAGLGRRGPDSRAGRVRDAAPAPRRGRAAPPTGSTRRTSTRARSAPSSTTTTSRQPPTARAPRPTAVVPSTPSSSRSCPRTTRRPTPRSTSLKKMPSAPRWVVRAFVVQTPHGFRAVQTPHGIRGAPIR